MNMILASGGPSPGTARVRERPRMHFWQVLTWAPSSANSANLSTALSSPVGEDSTRVRRAPTAGESQSRCGRSGGGAHRSSRGAAQGPRLARADVGAWHLSLRDRALGELVT